MTRILQEYVLSTERASRVCAPTSLLLRERASLMLNSTRKSRKIPFYVNTHSDDDEIWDAVGFYLGTACANVIFTMSAQKIVIGGGVMNREILYDKIRHHCFKALNNYIKHPRLASEEALKTFIVKSKYETDLGLIASAMIGSHGSPMDTL